MSGSSPITCKRDALSMLYSCKYNGNLSPDSGEAGAPVSSVVFPPIPYQACPQVGGVPQSVGCVSANQWPYGANGCVPRYTYNPSDPNAGMTNCTGPGHTSACLTLLELCEQEPILPLGVSEITENVAGGTDWPAITDTVGNGAGTDGGAFQLAGPLYIVKVTKGTYNSGDTNISGLDPLTFGPNLDIPDGSIDATKDLNIAFSCDVNNPTTAGAGCAGASDLVGLLITTSQHTKTAFSQMSAATGEATCSQAVSAMDHVTVNANQMTALLGGQTGGSLQIALVRLSTKLHFTVGTHPILAFTAGMGTFGFTNQ